MLKKMRGKVSKSYFTVQTAMTLKGGEADLVCLYGLDVNYSLDHFARNRQLKLLYVALSRARSRINVYLNYEVNKPSLLHRALEGSLLVHRFTSDNLTERKVEKSHSQAVVLRQEMSIKVDCMGLDKENSAATSSTPKCVSRGLLERACALRNF